MKTSDAFARASWLTRDCNLQRALSLAEALGAHDRCFKMRPGQLLVRGSRRTRPSCELQGSLPPSDAELSGACVAYRSIQLVRFAPSDFMLVGDVWWLYPQKFSGRWLISSIVDEENSACRLAGRPTPKPRILRGARGTEDGNPIVCRRLVRDWFNRVAARAT